MNLRRRFAQRLRRDAGPIALGVAFLALLSSMTGISEAAREALHDVVSKPRPGAVLKLDAKGKFPAAAIPKVASARRADRIGDFTADTIDAQCDADTVDIGTWCISSAAHEIPDADRAKVDWFYASRACAEDGGFLPSAAELVGAAPRIKLASYLTDSETDADIDILPGDGLSDRREMSSTLVTVEAGSSASGLLGVSETARGNPQTGEPNPVALPSVPAPDTLQYVTVVDNGDRGGVAGSKPVTQGERFRCGFYKNQGPGRETSATAK